MISTHTVILSGLVSALLVSASEDATPCEQLAGLAITQGTIAHAQIVARGPFVPPSRAGAAAAAGAAQAPILPEHCRVKLVLKPSSDSNINAELWLPTATWNGKFMAVGNGGFGGSIQGFGEMVTALRLGYATAGSDTGHNEADGPSGMFALG